MGLLDKFKKSDTDKKKIARPAKSTVAKTVRQPRIKKVTSTVAKPGKKEFSLAYKLLKRPVVTEKSVRLADEVNQYTFLVRPEANKTEVKKVIQDFYGVKVVGVKIINVPGKVRRLGRQTGFRSGYKKALVKLAADDKIDIVSR